MNCGQLQNSLALKVTIVLVIIREMTASVTVILLELGYKADAQGPPEGRCGPRESRKPQVAIFLNKRVLETWSLRVSLAGFKGSGSSETAGREKALVSMLTENMQLS